MQIICIKNSYFKLFIYKLLFWAIWNHMVTKNILTETPTDN